MSEVEYRPDIDGLRALAVLPVIIFHAGADWLPGGFVGVDIFFVISGFLISSIILREIRQDKFSFLNFYERRLRRIIPALLAMILVVVIVFQIIALPEQSITTSESGLAALLSMSNFYFWQQAGYFSPTAEFIPLLHTWSLSLEEQFYLLFPVFVLFLWRFNIPINSTLVFAIVIAFFISLWLSENKPSVAYYLLPARVWELGFGVVLASGVVPKFRGKLINQVVPAFGIGVIFFSFFYINSTMIFPGWVALLPCIGAAMVIHGDGKSWVSRRVLSSKPMIMIGLLSYSLYLWHWPVMSAIRIKTASIHLDLWHAIFSIVVTFFLAWLSWKYIEKPFRNRNLLPVKNMLNILGAASVVLFTIAAISVFNSGFPSRVGEPARIALSASKDVDPYRSYCQNLENHDGCKFGDIDAPVTYAIIGDSHAAAIRPAIEFSGLMGDASGTLYWKGACPLLEGAYLKDHPGRAECEDFKSSVWNKIESNEDLEAVILAGRWPFHMTGWLPESGGSNRTWLIDDKTVKASSEENSNVLRRSLGRSLDRLAALEVNVYVIGAVPEPGFDVPVTIALARHAGLDVPSNIRRSTVEERAGSADYLVKKEVEKRSGVRFLSIWESFCGLEGCKLEVDGVPIYYDDDHLSYNGAINVAAPAIYSQM